MEKKQNVNTSSDILAYSHYTENYIFEDLVETVDYGQQLVFQKPNEVSMLKDNSIPQELKERLGLVMVKTATSVISSDSPNRYRQSLSERQADAQNALNLLDDEKHRILEEQQSLDPDPQPSVE